MLNSRCHAVGTRIQFGESQRSTQVREQQEQDWLQQIQKRRHHKQPQQDASPFSRLDENFLVRKLRIDSLLLIAKRRLLIFDGLLCEFHLLPPTANEKACPSSITHLDILLVQCKHDP
jgi:hypothetical protein